MHNLYKLLATLALGAASLGLNPSASAGESAAFLYAYHSNHYSYPGERHYYRYPGERRHYRRGYDRDDRYYGRPAHRHGKHKHRPHRNGHHHKHDRHGHGHRGHRHRNHDHHYSQYSGIDNYAGKHHKHHDRKVTQTAVARAHRF